MAGTSKSSTAGAGSGGAVYGLGLIGALVIYWQNSEGLGRTSGRWVRHCCGPRS